MDFSPQTDARHEATIDIDWAPEDAAPLQTPALIRARRQLGLRAELPQEQLEALAASRRARAKRRQCLPLVHASGLFASGALLSYYGHSSAVTLTLLAGYGLIAAGLIVAVLTLATVFDGEQLPLQRFYREAELPASAAEIGQLTSVSRADPELARFTRAWWSGEAPIRKGDVQLALAFRHAKLGSR